MQYKTFELKSYDYKILEHLQDPDVLVPSYKLLSERLKIAPATLHRRITELRKAGFVRFTAILKAERVGKPLLALLYLKLYPPRVGGYESLDELVDHIKKMEEVEELYKPGGRWDLVAKIRVENIEKLDEFLKKKIHPLPIDDSQFEVILNTLKERGPLKPVPPEKLLEEEKRKQEEAANTAPSIE